MPLTSPIRSPRWSRWIYPDAVWSLPSINPSSPTAYLTFDDGPVPGVTDKILDILATEKIHATFFCIGRQVEEHPGLYQRILTEGHAVGNHSYSHTSGLKMSTPDYLADITRCDSLIDSPLFRPPYGRMRPAQYRSLVKHKKVIMYDVLSADFDERVSPEQSVKNVVDNVRNGSIILMHDNQKCGWKTVEYLSELVEKLKRKGVQLRIVPS